MSSSLHPPRFHTQKSPREYMIQFYKYATHLSWAQTILYIGEVDVPACVDPGASKFYNHGTGLVQIRLTSMGLVARDGTFPPCRHCSCRSGSCRLGAARWRSHDLCPRRREEPGEEKVNTFTLQCIGKLRTLTLYEVFTPKRERFNNSAKPVMAAGGCRGKTYLTKTKA